MIQNMNIPAILQSKLRSLARLKGTSVENLLSTIVRDEYTWHNYYVGDANSPYESVLGESGITFEELFNGK